MQHTLHSYRYNSPTTTANKQIINRGRLLTDGHRASMNSNPASPVQKHELIKKRSAADGS